MARSSRPIFLNLMQIQMPVGALTSIGHRLTGVLLAAGVRFSLYFLYLSLHSEQTFAAMMSLLSYPAIKGVMFALVWALAHHLLAGVRSSPDGHRCRFNAALSAAQCLVGEPERRRHRSFCCRGFAMKFKFTGLAAWRVQRISAVYMLLFVLFMLGALWLHPRPSYVEWRSWVGQPGMSVAILVFFAALLSHMWVGLRDVLLDYARPAGLRCFLLGLLGISLFGTAAWVLWLLLQVQS